MGQFSIIEPNSQDISACKPHEPAREPAREPVLTHLDTNQLQMLAKMIVAQQQLETFQTPQTQKKHQVDTPYAADAEKSRCLRTSSKALNKSVTR